MIKKYILDTNVLLQDPEALFNFKENIVVIAIGVLEELDKFKKEHNQLGKNSREVCRSLDKLRIQGNLTEGVPLNNGHNGILKIVFDRAFGDYHQDKKVDLQLIHIATQLVEKEPEIPCVIVSKDVKVRVHANAFGITAEDYETKSVKEEINKGYVKVECTTDLVTDLLTNEKIHIDDFTPLHSMTIYPNYYLIIPVINTENNSTHNIYAKISSDRNYVVLLNKLRSGLRLNPKNYEQMFVLDALLDDNVKLVSIIGSAGTGKTLLATAAGYHMMMKEGIYSKLLISRPMTPMGNKDVMGFLPGTAEEKVDPWMKPIYDSFEVLMSNKKQHVDGKQFVLMNPKISIEILSYIRGRSIHDQYFIIDEAQNVSPLEIKTIITRAGENTKIVLTGDINQIDNPYMDKTTNGLTIATNAFLDSEISSHVVMSCGVRSKLSQEASQRL